MSLFHEKPILRSKITDFIPTGETMYDIKMAKREICRTNIKSDERLAYSDEYAGDFAVRYQTMLIRQRRKKHERYKEIDNAKSRERRSRDQKQKQLDRKQKQLAKLAKIVVPPKEKVLIPTS
jgi:hypothetical protein